MSESPPFIENQIAPLALPQIDVADDPSRGLDWISDTFGPRLVVLFDPGNHHSPQGTKLDATTRARAVGLLRSHNNDRVRMNSYFHLNPTKPEFKGKKAAETDIAAIEVVGQADVDAKSGRTLPDCWAAVCALPLPPSFIIASGGGFQVGYLLTEPLPPTEENKAWTKSVNKKLQRLTGGDAVDDISRVFRVPYTMNWPNEAKQRGGRVPTLSGLVVGVNARRYSWAEIQGTYPVTTVVENVVAFPGAPPAIMVNRPSSLAAAQANMPGHWFDRLPTGQKNSLVWALARHLVQYADKPREEWRPVYAGFHDAGLRGATEGEAAAFWWCRTSKRCDEADIANSWAKSHPAGPGGSTIGTLIDLGARTGFDFTPWRTPDEATNTTPPANTIAQGAPLSQMPHLMDERAATVHLNARLCSASDWGGAPCFGRFNPNGTPTRLKPADLPVLLSARFVEVSDGKGNTKHIPAANWWVHSPNKLTFDRVIYDPESNRARPAEKILNQWTGFAVEPAKGCWRLMGRHLWEVICARDIVAYRYLIYWLADVVQHPGSSSEVMVVLRSDREGVGKSSVGQWILGIFGVHGLEVTDSRHVLGEFNDSIEGKSFALLEEAVFPGEHQAAGQLKAVLTAKKLTINPKGHAAYQVPNTLHFLLTTNARWAVPAGADARRFFVLDVQQKKPRAYFDALWAEVRGEGVAAMLYALLKVDLTDFNIREVPTTAALIDQQRRSADDVSQWITDAVVNNELVPNAPNGGFNYLWPSKKLHELYRFWCGDQGIRRPKNALQFGRILGEIGLARSTSHNPVKWTVPSAQALLSASDHWAGIRKRP